MSKVALVPGLSGMVGRAIAGRLSSLGWRVVGFSRTAPNPAIDGVEHVAADLTDREAVFSALSAHAAETSHLFYAGRAPDPDLAVEADRNLAMLRHVVEGLEAAGAPLVHVHLMEGCKWYGSHLGPYLTPAREDDPRHAGRNFYHDQQDYVEARVRAGAAWTWSALRPHVLTGFSLGYPHNIAGVIAAMAEIRKARGEPLSFPGTQACFDSLTQFTDIDVLVDAMLWCVETPAAAGEAFNVICADYVRWRDIWGEIAEFFGMPAGEVAPERLTDSMAGAEILWREVAARDGLAEPDIARIGNWGYGDINFRIWWDDLASTAKIRKAGFEQDTSRIVTSREALFKALRGYREAGVIG